MKICPNCGALLADTANFCSSCGAVVSGITPNLVGVEPDDLDIGYRVILFSRGSCRAAVAREVISDLLGYSLNTVKELMDEVPVEIADELTEMQAIVIAQALAEYGMDVTIVDENNQYVNFSNRAVSSVFNSDGSLIADALAVFATLSAANRVHRYRRYRKPSFWDLLFQPTYRRVEPVHVRRHVVRDPEPRRRLTIYNQPRQVYQRTNGKVHNTMKPQNPTSGQKPTQNKPAQGLFNTRPNKQTVKPAETPKPQSKPVNKPSARTSNETNRPTGRAAITEKRPSSHTGSSHTSKGGKK